MGMASIFSCWILFVLMPPMKAFSYSLPSLESFLMMAVMEMFWAGNLSYKDFCMYEWSLIDVDSLICTAWMEMLCEWGWSPWWKDVLLFLRSRIIKYWLYSAWAFWFQYTTLSCPWVMWTDFYLAKLSCFCRLTDLYQYLYPGSDLRVVGEKMERLSAAIQSTITTVVLKAHWKRGWRGGYG